MADHPSFNLPEVERRRDRLLERIFLPYFHAAITGEIIDGIVRQLQEELPAGATRDALFESVRYLAGRELQPPEALRLCWRLSGNIPRLRDGLAVLPWATQAADEWVPLQVLQAQLSLDTRGNRGMTYTFRVLAGTPCPMRITTFWKTGLIHVIARRMGFSSPWHNFPFQHPTELVGLRLLAQVIAERSRNRPVIFDVACPDSLIKWNRENVLNLRFRRGPENQCPRNWKHPCHRCAIGYDECIGSTHRLTYERGVCNGCGNAEALFDPELQSLHCIHCTQRELLRRT